MSNGKDVATIPLDIFDRWTDGASLLDGGGTILYANPAAARLTGRAHGSLPGLRLAALFSGGDSEALAAGLARLGGGPAERFELEAPGGGALQIDLARTAAGTIFALLREHATGDALRQERASREQAESGLRFAELFTGVLAHDLRNPLSSIVLAADQLRLGSREPQHERIARRIQRGGERMSRMIDQMLDFTRIRIGGGLELEPRQVAMAGLLRGVMDELSGGHPERRVELVVRGDAVGTWDDDRLAQVFSNLLGNALQHGSREAAVIVELDGGAAEAVVVTVHSGGAIAGALLPVLFEPFRGSASYAHGAGRGLGLGLYITDQIVRAHGGAITVRSTEAEGTAFIIHLPRHAAAAGGR